MEHIPGRNGARCHIPRPVFPYRLDHCALASSDRSSTKTFEKHPAVHLTLRLSSFLFLSFFLSFFLPSNFCHPPSPATHYSPAGVIRLDALATDAFSDTTKRLSFASRHRSSLCKALSPRTHSSTYYGSIPPAVLSLILCSPIGKFPISHRLFPTCQYPAVHSKLGEKYEHCRPRSITYPPFSSF